VEWVHEWFTHYNQDPRDINPAGPKQIIQALDKAVTWRIQHRIPLWMGEFGAYEKADMQSRVNWTKFVREEAEARGISWAYWEFGAGFGIYDRKVKAWNKDLLNALIPNNC
jgi:endoglucanase